MRLSLNIHAKTKLAPWEHFRVGTEWHGGLGHRNKKSRMKVFYAREQQTLTLNHNHGAIWGLEKVSIRRNMQGRQIRGKRQSHAGSRAHLYCFRIWAVLGAGCRNPRTRPRLRGCQTAQSLRQLEGRDKAQEMGGRSGA